MILQVLCALLFIAGFFILLNIHPKDAFAPLLKPFQKRRDRIERVWRITGKRKSRIAGTLDNAKEMLFAAGMSGKIYAYRWTALIMAAIGLLIGLALNNILAAMVLVVGMGCAPLIVIRIRTGDYIRSLNEKLESAMSTVTNSYISSGDLIGAVENSLHLLPSPVDNIFRQFYSETQFIDSDVIKALHHIREKIDNRYWRDWCDVLAQCQRDRQMRFALSGIVTRLGEMRRVQMEVDTNIRKQISDYIITALIVLGAIPLMGSMIPDCYTMLTTTPVGKITLAVVLAAILATAIWVAQLYRQVEGGGRR